jgi:hypothetical protein
MLAASFILFAVIILTIVVEGMYENKAKKGGSGHEESSEFF